jgi:RNA polymerase sigma-70 factor (ECF subfamily)
MGLLRHTDWDMKQRFKKMVEQHRDRIFTFAYYNLGNREEAEDVTQEVLLRIWQNLEAINEATQHAWINKVSRNACIDAARRRRAYRTRVVATADGETVFGAASHEPSPEDRAVASSLRSRIQGALSELQEPYKSVVILREIQEMKYEEISASLELPLNTVKSYLHRGRRMLREQLSETNKHE